VVVLLKYRKAAGIVSEVATLQEAFELAKESQTYPVLLVHQSSGKLETPFMTHFPVKKLHPAFLPKIGTWDKE
jgi:hypothetical protein